MRLVIKYTYGDDCTWSATDTVPVDYDCPEAFIVDFEAAYNVAIEDDRNSFRFAENEWETYCFHEWNKKQQRNVFVPPEILTVDEWFKNS